MFRKPTYIVDEKANDIIICGHNSVQFKPAMYARPFLIMVFIKKVIANWRAQLVTDLVRCLGGLQLVYGAWNGYLENIWANNWEGEFLQIFNI